MSEVEQAALRLESEAIRQRGYWRSKPQTQLACTMYWFWNWVIENSYDLIESSLKQKYPIIKAGEQGQQPQNSLE